jgi:hypothetical protein
VFDACETFFDQALEFYRQGQERDGFNAMENARKALRKVPSQ